MAQEDGIGLFFPVSETPTSKRKSNRGIYSRMPLETSCLALLQNRSRWAERYVINSGVLWGNVIRGSWKMVSLTHVALLVICIVTPMAVEELKSMASFLDESELESSLYDGVDQDEVNFGPVFELAAELFTHLGIDCMYRISSYI
jgi:hypothetical protein